MPASPPPDPQQGVFETLLVAGGRPVELEAHLARLAASLRELFDTAFGAEAHELVGAEAAGLRLGRLRLDAKPRNGGIELAARRVEIDPAAVFPERAAALRSLLVAGGLGSHKWADRALLERAEAEMPDGAAALLLDADGSVLEASRASVFAVRKGILVTPPLDGRILPGVARAMLIEVAGFAGLEVREESLTAADLIAAEEVFLTGSVRGVEPAASLDGAALQSPGRLMRLVAEGLRDRWRI